MAIDRAATLRNAEKLLRQGKVDAAITEYVRVVEDNPRDWNTANALGDLYVRAGKTDQAVEQFIRIADSLYEQGFLQKATALYKKVLKLKPDAEHALLQAGEIAAQQGFYADARTHLGAVVDRRNARGDARGSVELRVRLGSLDATDFEARIAAATARLEIDDVAGTVRDLVQIAAELGEMDRQADAVKVLRRAAALAPDDEGVRARLVDLSLSSIEQQLRSGRSDDALVAAKELIEADPSRSSQVATIGWNVATQAPDAAFLIVELAAGSAAARREWEAAAAVLQEFVARAPHHVSALLRLVEICVDGGLEQSLCAAQGQLADAYIAAGQAAEARYIAEDLIARHPSETANVDRFRRVLELLGEANPDAIIEDRLSGQSSLSSSDLIGEEPAFFEAGEGGGPAADIPTGETPTPAASRSEPMPTVLRAQPQDAEGSAESTPRLNVSDRTTVSPPERRPAHEGSRPVDVFELSANSIDIESILGEFETTHRQTKPATAESVEVDLSVVLDDIKRPPALPPLIPRAGAAPAKKALPFIEGTDIDAVFSQLRDEASRRSAINAAEQEFRRGLALKAAGDIDGCIAALQSASRAPKLRFATASQLGRIFRERGRTADAVDWFERAAQAPAPTPADYHVLLFELAELLEAEGETVRALAVCLELQADAGDYRDVATRVDRLAKVQARG